jgi:hypothetical protein
VPAFAAYRHRLICDGNVVGGLILLRAPEGGALVGMTILSVLSISLKPTEGLGHHGRVIRQRGFYA